MKIFVSVKEDGTVEGWGSSRAMKTEKEMEIDENHPFLNDAPIYYKVIDGEFIKNDEAVLDRARKQKDKELKRACNLEILAGFSHEINGVTYWFSYDMEAQGNFRDARDILKDGLKSEITFTAREGGVNGPYTRIPVNLEIMQQLTLVIMEHKLSKISKYRDELMPIVDAAERPEDVQAVTWE